MRRNSHTQPHHPAGAARPSLRAQGFQSLVAASDDEAVSAVDDGGFAAVVSQHRVDPVATQTDYGDEARMQPGGCRIHVAARVAARASVPVVSSIPAQHQAANSRRRCSRQRSHLSPTARPPSAVQAAIAWVSAEHLPGLVREQGSVVGLAHEGTRIDAVQMPAAAANTGSASGNAPVRANIVAMLRPCPLHRIAMVAFVTTRL